MEALERTVHVFTTRDGEAPFTNWVRGLRDRRARVRINARLHRLQQGNFGDFKSVGDGVQELRIDHGPGYRVYFGQDGDVLVILLCGGAKKTQSKDIERAKAYWREYKDAK